MIIASRTQFHVERGLLRDYEPSDGTFWSTSLHSWWWMEETTVAGSRHTAAGHMSGERPPLLPVRCVARTINHRSFSDRKAGIMITFFRTTWNIKNILFLYFIHKQKWRNDTWWMRHFNLSGDAMHIVCSMQCISLRPLIIRDPCMHYCWVWSCSPVPCMTLTVAGHWENCYCMIVWARGRWRCWPNEGCSALILFPFLAANWGFLTASEDLFRLMSGKCSRVGVNFVPAAKIRQMSLEWFSWPKVYH